MSTAYVLLVYFPSLGYLDAWYLCQDTLQITLKQLSPSLIFELFKHNLLEKFGRHCEAGGKQTVDID